MVAVCDPSEEVRDRQRVAGFGGAIHETLDELLADPAVQTLVVCSPDRFHAEALVQGVAAGKHVLVEKPVADRQQDLRSCGTS